MIYIFAGEQHRKKFMVTNHYINEIFREITGSSVHALKVI